MRIERIDPQEPIGVDRVRPLETAPSVDPLPAGWYGRRVDGPGGGANPTVVEWAGSSLLLWKAEGRWVASDVRCPHAGASLAGGRIERGNLVCPFHGNTISATGTTRAPGCEQVAPFALGVRPVGGADDVVLVWHGPEGERSKWPAPVPASEPPSERWCLSNSTEVTVNASIREIFENVVDLEHFVPVHGEAEAPEIVSISIDHPRLEVRMRHHLAPRGRPVEIVVKASGPGCLVTEFGDPAWMRVVSYHWPLQERRTLVGWRCWVRASAPGSRRHEAGVALGAQLVAELQQDDVIWSERDPTIDRRSSPALSMVRSWLGG